MSSLFWFAVALAAWVAASTLIGLLVGWAFKAGRKPDVQDEPERDWQWPPRQAA